MLFKMSKVTDNRNGPSLQGSRDNSSLKRFLIKAATGSIGLKVGNAFLVYGISLLLARYLGAAEYGLYAYAMAWGSLLTVPAVLGLEGLVTREIAIYRTKEQWGLMKGLLRWSNQLVGLWSLLLAVLFACTIWLLPSTVSEQQKLALWLVLCSLPFLALTRLRQSSMQALQQIVRGQLPEMLFRPTALITLLSVSGLWLGSKFTASWALLMYGISIGLAFLLGQVLLTRAVPRSCRDAIATYKPWIWLQMALPMLLIGGMYIINNQTDTVMLGMLKTTQDVGVYTVANRGASLIGFVLIAVNTTLGPTFASVYAQGNKAKLQRIVTQGCRWVLLSAVAISITLILGRHVFLGLFGNEFLRGETTLIILCLGQLANACTGSVAFLLLMTGHERDTAIGVTTSAVLNIFLNYVLIPDFGIGGAATATAISMGLWNLILVILAYKRLGINSTIFGKAN